jgi:hypothetical protein
MWFVLRFCRSALWPISCPALELGFCCVGLLGACFFASPPFSGARSEICQPALCCQCVMLVCWLLFNFAMSFDFECCSLAQDMRFVDRYLPYFRHGLSPTHCLHFCLSNLCLLKVPAEISSLLLPLLQCAQNTPTTLLSVLFSSLFINQFFFFFLQGRGLSVQGAMLIYPRGSCGNTVCWLFACLLVCSL